MTTQTPDTIFYDGSGHLTFDEPLSSYSKLPNFMAFSTANHRGYSAVWAVVREHLFIVSLSGCVVDNAGDVFKLTFPGADRPVQASWYSGDLNLLSGRLIEQGDINPIYEHETALAVENGRVHHLRTVNREYLPRRNFDPILFRPVAELDELASLVLNALAAANINTIGDLVLYGELELIRAAALSIDTAFEVKEALACRGLILGTRMNGWPPQT
jgi:hypothetical protein